MLERTVLQTRRRQNKTRARQSRCPTLQNKGELFMMSMQSSCAGLKEGAGFICVHTVHTPPQSQSLSGSVVTVSVQCHFRAVWVSRKPSCTLAIVLARRFRCRLYDFLSWCYTSTETIWLIRDEGKSGVGNESPGLPPCSHSS